MSDLYKNCWEILNCEREEGGSKVGEFGECRASVEGLGHSCWALSGTFCDGKIQGTMSQKEPICMKCDVYQQYNRETGKDGKIISAGFPEEQEIYEKLIQI